MADTASTPAGPYECTKDTCSAENTIMGYAPTFGASVAFCILFFLTTFAHAFQGVKYRQWFFGSVMVIGALAEAIGYIGRILLSHRAGDPFSADAFKLQVVLLTFAPAFLTAGIYLQLKHLVITFGSSLSRLPPAWYTYLFIGCDFLSIVLQGAGGGLASAADGPGALMDAGNGVMMAGLSFQVFTLIVFGGLAGEFLWKVKRSGGVGMNEQTAELRKSRKFKGFLWALAVAFFAILTRCVYRIAEMSEGWGSELMRDEVAFIVLDPVLCVVACIVLNVFHPGDCFQFKRRFAADAAATTAEKGVSDYSSDESPERRTNASS